MLFAILCPYLQECFFIDFFFICYYSQCPFLTFFFIFWGCISCHLTSFFIFFLVFFFTELLSLIHSNRNCNSKEHSFILIAFSLLDMILVDLFSILYQRICILWLQQILFSFCMISIHEWEFLSLFFLSLYRCLFCFLSVCWWFNTYCDMKYISLFFVFMSSLSLSYLPVVVSFDYIVCF